MTIHMYLGQFKKVTCIDPHLFRTLTAIDHGFLMTNGAVMNDGLSCHQ